MIGRKKRRQATLFIPGDIRDYIPEDHILVRVDKILGEIRISLEITRPVLMRRDYA